MMQNENRSQKNQIQSKNEEIKYSVNQVWGMLFATVATYSLVISLTIIVSEIVIGIMK